jgi:hypothetical protein
MLFTATTTVVRATNRRHRDVRRSCYRASFSGRSTAPAGTRRPVDGSSCSGRRTVVRGSVSVAASRRRVVVGDDDVPRPRLLLLRKAAGVDQRAQTPVARPPYVGEAPDEKTTRITD